MFHVEILTGGRELPADDREQIAADITTALLGLDAPEQTTPEAQRSMRGARAFTSVAFGHAAGWIADGRAVGTEDRRRHLVRVWVPDAWYDEAAAHAIRAIGGVFGAVQDDREHDDHDHPTWIHVLGVPEHGCGTLDGPISSSEILRLITTHGDPPEGSATEPEPGTAIDPVCGMVVRLGPDALTLDHDGTTQVFCAGACRRAYAEQNGVDVPARDLGVRQKGGAG